MEDRTLMTVLERMDLSLAMGVCLGIVWGQLFGLTRGSLNPCSANEAEFWALLFGVSKLRNALIERDYLNVIRSCRFSACPPSRWMHIRDRIAISFILFCSLMSIGKEMRMLMYS
ncbi:hypothetical protein AMTRI_Chr09g21830 [Amborella trichopoda]